MDATQNGARVLAGGNLNGGLVAAAARLLMTPAGPSLAAIVCAFLRWFQLPVDDTGPPIEAMCLAVVVAFALVVSLLASAIGAWRERWVALAERPVGGEAMPPPTREGG